MNLLYIIGVPGAGKTTLMRELVLGRRRRVVPKPFAHTVYEDGLVQLGRDREQFGGTDALSMSVQPLVTAALETRTWSRVIAEGDRLANPSFFTAARNAGYEVDVALLDAAPELATERRADRGSDQSDSWLRGRASKVDNLRDHVTIFLDAARTPADNAVLLADHPVLMTPSDLPNTKETPTC